MEDLDYEDEIQELNRIKQYFWDKERNAHRCNTCPPRCYFDSETPPRDYDPTEDN